MFWGKLHSGSRYKKTDLKQFVKDEFGLDIQ